MRIIELTYTEWAYMEQALHPMNRFIDKETGALVMPGGDFGFKRVKELNA